MLLYKVKKKKLMIMKSTTVFCLVMLLVLVSMSAEAKKKNHTMHRNSTKWKEHKKKLNLGFLNEDKETNA